MTKIGNVYRSRDKRDKGRTVEVEAVDLDKVTVSNTATGKITTINIYNLTDTRKWEPMEAVAETPQLEPTLYHPDDRVYEVAVRVSIHARTTRTVVARSASDARNEAKRRVREESPIHIQDLDGLEELELEYDIRDVATGAAKRLS